MRNLKSIIVVAFVSLVIASCDKDNEPTLAPVEAKTAANIYAPVTTDRTVNPPAETGEFTKFSFKTGAVVTNDSWDIAFRGTTILINGGAKYGFVDEPERKSNVALAIKTGTFASIIEAPSDKEFKQDSQGKLALPKGSWFTYAGPPSHKISPITGQVFVLKTVDGNYVKMEIRSYYKDMDDSNSGSSTNSGSRYYTFDYVYNPNKGEKSFE